MLWPSLPQPKELSLSLTPNENSITFPKIWCRGGGPSGMLPISNSSKHILSLLVVSTFQTYFYDTLGQTQRKRTCIIWRQIPMQIKRLNAKSLINSIIRLQAAHFHGFVLKSRQHHDAHKVHCKI